MTYGRWINGQLSIEGQAYVGDRKCAVLFLREHKEQTFEQIAEDLTTTSGYAYTLYLRACQRREEYSKRSKNPLFGLSTRAQNCLRDTEFNTRKKILAAVNDGRLVPPKQPSSHQWRMGIQPKGYIRNYGLKTHNEVLAWVGLPALRLPTQRYRCPYCAKRIHHKDLIKEGT